MLGYYLSPEGIINLLTFVIIYGITTTLAGAIKARVALFFGDDTAYYMGLTSFDPLLHVDPVGFLVLVIAGFGWGKNVPINPYNIDQPHRSIKLILAHYAGAGTHFLLALLWVFSLVSIFGSEFSNSVGTLLEYNTLMSFSDIILSFPELSTLTLMATYFFMYGALLNMFLFVIDTIVETVNLTLFFITSRSPEYFNLYFYHRFLITIILFIFLSEPLTQLILTTVLGLVRLLTTYY